MFINRTPRGALAAALKAEEDKLSVVMKKNIKIIERNGTQLQRLLTRADPWSGEDCGRQDCTVCSQPEDKTPDCRMTNLTYRTVCRLCKEEGNRSTYVGETSRSLHERQKEHAADSKTNKEGSHMFQHLATAHGDRWDADNLEEKPWEHFKVELVKSHRSSFIRQIHEAVTMMLEPGVVLNNQEEYNRCLVPSLEVRGARKESTQTKSAREQRQEKMSARQATEQTTGEETRTKRRTEQDRDTRQTKKTQKDHTDPTRGAN